MKVDVLGTFFKQNNQIKFVPAGPLCYTLRISYNAQAQGDSISGRVEDLNYSKVNKVAGISNAKEQLDKIFKKMIT